jgi:hypothetical protein
MKIISIIIIINIMKNFKLRNLSKDQSKLLMEFLLAILP